MKINYNNKKKMNSKMVYNKIHRKWIWKWMHTHHSASCCV